MLCDAFSSVLRSARADFNAQFAQTKREHPSLDEAGFSSFVETHLDPIVRAGTEEESFGIASIAWECALELVAQRLAGPQARHPWINETWERLAEPFSRAPRELIAAFSNAAHQVAATPGARPGQWLDLVGRVADTSADPTSLLKAGQIAAWRAGLAHYRGGALKIAAELNPELVRLALGADSAVSLETLAASAWIEAESSRREPLRVGAFRGFDGLFTLPPTVRSVNDQILVRSGDEVWLLTADSYGATFHRATLEEFESGTTTSVSAPADIGSITSAARTRDTVAVTGSLTHAILLFAA